MTKQNELPNLQQDRDNLVFKNLSVLQRFLLIRFLSIWQDNVRGYTGQLTVLSLMTS